MPLMIIKNVFILIYLFLISILSLEAKSYSINDITSISKKESGRQLLLSWDSINYIATKRNIEFSQTEWEKRFEVAYKKAILDKDDSLTFDLSIPLSFIYHTETKFSKGTPLLQNILKRKYKLSNEVYKLVLIKLEEEYRATNNIEDAIAIRKERISNNFINNYWEIYKDCGLYEAAKKDLLQFVKIPDQYTYKRLQYYFLLGELYMNMKEYDSALIVYNRGLEDTKATIEFNLISKTFIVEKLNYWETCFLGYIAKCNFEKGNYTNAIEI